MAFPVALIPALFQAGVGVKQMLSGNKDLRNLERPTYETPKEMLTALGLSKAEFADPRFAGQSQVEAQTGLAASQALQAAQNRGAGMQSVGQIASATNQSHQGIAAQVEQSQRSDLQNYQNMLGLISQYRDKEFQMNEFAPYMDKYNEAREQRGAGQENIFGALDGMAVVTQRLLGNNNAPVMAPAQAAQSAGTATMRSSVFDNYLRSQMGNIQKGTAMWQHGIKKLNKSL